jgi:hypothetical protein
VFTPYFLPFHLPTVKCIQRWEKVLRPGLVKGKWTDEEDDLLRQVVRNGYEHWGKVAEKMPGRTSKQCRERWANYLDPSLLKTAFSPGEDDLLLRLQGEMGNKWACIARQLPGRTENSVKLRYHALIKAYANGANGGMSADAMGAMGTVGSMGMGTVGSMGAGSPISPSTPSGSSGRSGNGKFPNAPSSSSRKGEWATHKSYRFLDC